MAHQSSRVDHKDDRPEYEGAIGIDLGTTFSCVAVLLGDSIEVIVTDTGGRTMPSYVSFAAGEKLVGDAAKNVAASNPKNTIFDAKRLIGRRFEDETVQQDIKHWPFKVVSCEGEPRIQVQTMMGEEEEKPTLFAPEEISGMVLSKLKEHAEAKLGKRVTKTVITVPAYFNDAQRKATQHAGELAGLTVLRIINEPTAAAIAFEHVRGKVDKSTNKSKNVLVFDLGGGTFDVSLVVVGSSTIDVKATNGNTHLGGEDFDNRLIEYVCDEIKRKQGKDLSGNERVLRRLRAKCEQAKRQLSNAAQASIDDDAFDTPLSISRAKFEQINANLFEKTLEPVKQVLSDAKLEKSQVDEIVLVGGSTRIPKVRQLLSEFFDGKKLNESVHPDEAVAIGAALEAASRVGQKQDLLLIDVCPLSLGIEVKGGLMYKIIKRNSTVPTSKSQHFTTVEDNQTSIKVSVFEGEHPIVSNNHLLGEFLIDGIPSAPARKESIKVTLDLNQDAMLHVTAVVASTGQTKEIEIEKNPLSAEEVARRIAQAEEMRDRDRQNAAKIDAKNALEAYVHEVQRKLSMEWRELEAEMRTSIIGVVETANAWLEQHSNATVVDDAQVFTVKQEGMRRQIGRLVMPSNFVPIDLGETDQFEQGDEDENDEDPGYTVFGDISGTKRPRISSSDDEQTDAGNGDSDQDSEGQTTGHKRTKYEHSQKG